jgi:hypothetical protein
MKKIMSMIKIIIGAVVAGVTRAFVAEKLDSQE